MNREDALELVERMPYIRTIQAANDKARPELYRIALDSQDPVEWIKVIKSDYIRRNDRTARRYPAPEETRIAGEARERLYEMLAGALGIPEDDMDRFIEDYIRQTQ